MRTGAGSFYDAVSDGIAESGRSPALAYLVTAIFAIGAGFGFVTAAASGNKALLAFLGAAILFAVFASFLGRFKPFLIALLILCLPLQMDFHLIYDPVPVETTPFMAGVPIDMTDLVLLVLYGHWLWTLAWTKRAGRVRVGHPLGTLLLIWICVSLITSYFVAHAFRYSVYEVIALAKGFFLFFYLVNNTSTESDLRLITGALLAAMFSHATYAVFQFATGLNYTLHGETPKWIGPEGFRSIGFFGSPDAAAALMTFILPVAVAYYFVVKQGRARALVLPGILVTIAGIMATKVRAAWLAAAISFGALALVSYYRGRISSTTFTKAALAAVLILVLASPFVYVRMETGTYGEDRIPLLLTAMNMVKDHWLLGVGANNYYFNIDQYVPISFRHQWAYTVHNEYLLRLAEGGIFGFFFYYLLNVMLLVKLWRITKSPSPWLYAVSIGLFAAMIGSIPHRFFSFYHYVNLYYQFTVVLAVTVLAERLYRNASTGKSRSPRA
jgi:hypothetical protein